MTSRTPQPLRYTFFMLRKDTSHQFAVGALLRSARQRRQMTLDEVARTLGCAKSAIGHWESGYAPFRWYIHNTSATLNYGGADNVLAVRVDGVTHQEGWCELPRGGGHSTHPPCSPAARPFELTPSRAPPPRAPTHAHAHCTRV